jgi:acetyl/propionyl-CoA carboxylase alpha subunit
MDYEFLVDGKAHKISLEQGEGKLVATLNGNRMELDIHQVSPRAVSLLVDGKVYLAYVAKHGAKTFVAIKSSRFCLEEPEQGSAAARRKGGAADEADGTIKAPMPGLVIKVNVVEGSAVGSGDSLVVVEAMKMEHEMRAPFRATVEKVHVKAGQQVDTFQPLVELKPIQTEHNPG